MTSETAASHEAAAAGAAAIDDCLNRAGDLLKSDAVDEASHLLFQELASIRASMEESLWRRCIIDARVHPTLALVHKSPFVRHCYLKPRGYPGDAVLIDFIYREPISEEYLYKNTDLSDAHNNPFINMRPAEAVRRRRKFFADEIDALSDRSPGGSVLAIACGHFQELALSRAQHNCGLSRIVGLDQDEKSLAFAQKHFAHVSNLEILCGSAFSLLALDNDIGHFDLVYAAGLYDYLSQEIARRITRSLFEMVKPGGALIIPNFLSSTLGAGAMEALMDWWLIYRDEQQIRDFAAEIPIYEIASITYRNDLDEIGYLSIKKSM
ncbi:class I SAM-dependent methyltransferase [Methylobacterium sp. WL122]|nr:class I SAM-dependent methyltransferase [Methylobacterium sp. WL122]